MEHHDRVRFLFAAALILCAAQSLSAADAKQVLLQKGTSIAEELTGMVFLAIEPPFPGAQFTVTIDGQVVSRRLGPPYRIDVDFGSPAVERTIQIATLDNRGKQRDSWKTVVNRGRHALGVKLREVDPARLLFEASVTAPASDPVVRVDFYDQDGLLSTLHEPPYRLTAEPKSANGLIRVTATAKSGAETTDFFSTSGEIFAQSYEVRTVDLYVSVVGPEGTTREEVPASKFQVIDNGTPGKIIKVGKAAQEPISISMIVDASGSMAFHLPKAKSAASEFLDRVLKPEDRFALYAIHTTPKRHLSLSPAIETAPAAVAALKPEGETALYDALATAMREIRSEKRRRALVVLSDGEDTSSIASYDDILKQASSAAVPIYIIAFGDANRGDLDRLKYLTSQTGGFLVNADAANLGDRYRAIEQDLREQYSIRYQIADLAKPQEWRQVRVLLKSPSLEARTIRGYFTP